MPSPRTATPIDRHVGRRIRAGRRMLKMTQVQVAEKLGITFQQMQKYESGASRVAASRLYDMACCYGVEVDFFFDGLEGLSGKCKVAEPRLDADAAAALETAQRILGRLVERLYTPAPEGHK